MPLLPPGVGPSRGVFNPGAPSGDSAALEPEKKKADTALAAVPKQGGTAVALQLIDALAVIKASSTAGDVSSSGLALAPSSLCSSLPTSSQVASSGSWPTSSSLITSSSLVPSSLQGAGTARDDVTDEDVVGLADLQGAGEVKLLAGRRDAPPLAFSTRGSQKPAMVLTSTQEQKQEALLGYDVGKLCKMAPSTCSACWNTWQRLSPSYVRSVGLCSSSSSLPR